MELETLKLLAEAGVTGVFALFLILTYRLATRLADLIFSTLNNHLKDLTGAIQGLRDELQNNRGKRRR